MSFRDFLPFQQSPSRTRSKKAQILAGDDQKALVKAFKVAGLALGFINTTSLGATNRTNFEQSPYDFDRIIEAIDTDSFVKQGFNKYRELIWNEGWDIVGENTDAVEYIYQRLDFMEFAMSRPFHDFLVEIGDQLVKFGNAFVAKARGDLKPFYPDQLFPAEGKEPVVGYYVIPAETVEINRDRHNKVKGYRQMTDHLTSSFQDVRSPRWAPEEVIHFAVDKKPGRAFGTPFIIAAIDDVVSLRQMEEDILNLVHRDLSPFYVYKVGSEESPPEPEEIEEAINQLNDMRAEGGLAIPGHHSLEVLGAQGAALDVTNPLAEFVGRVCAGLGLSPHHLGLTMNGGNRAVTDRLDIALYNKIKGYQRYIADMIRLHIFGELLLEGGFDPVATPQGKGKADRCLFKFREIDVDTQVKKETHEIQKFAADLTARSETRLVLGLDPEVDEDETLLAITARLTPQQTDPGLPKISTKPGATFPGGGVPPGNGNIAPTPGSSGVPKKPDAATPSAGGVANQPNKIKKQIGNQVRPINQHGRRTSPNIRHSELDENWLEEVEAFLDDE